MTGAGGLAVSTVIIGAPGDTITSASATTYVDAILGSQSITVDPGAASGASPAGVTGAAQRKFTPTFSVRAAARPVSRIISAAGGKGRHDKPQWLQSCQRRNPLEALAPVREPSAPPQLPTP